MITGLDEFKAWLRPRLASSSFANYSGMLDKWSLSVNGSQPTKQAAEDFLSSLERKGVSDSFLVSYMTLLRRYFTWKGDAVEFTMPELVRAKTRHKERMRERHRSGMLTVSSDGKSVAVCAPGKRKWTGHCELCKKTRRLYYHHWDDKDYSKGLWLCLKCHMTAETADAGVSTDEYLKLRQTVDKRANTDELRRRVLRLKSMMGTA